MTRDRFFLRRREGVKRFSTRGSRSRFYTNVKEHGMTLDVCPLEGENPLRDAEREGDGPSAAGRSGPPAGGGALARRPPLGGGPGQGSGPVAAGGHRSDPGPGAPGGDPGISGRRGSSRAGVGSPGAASPDPRRDRAGL